ncbi:hypothetical protein P9738_07105 [Bacillus siamensis]|uniref:hypothetical protein n=1 Tax=Bacillus siamensis TaxID=659243 RepID=UPI002E1ABA38|nr:hypothetical protein [Bacillus siamensis]MED5096050.1 hypothetical protein [Bacillus siamensis]
MSEGKTPRVYGAIGRASAGRRVVKSPRLIEAVRQPDSGAGQVPAGWISRQLHKINIDQLKKSIFKPNML